MPSYSLTVVGPQAPYRGGIAHFTEMTISVLRSEGHDVRGINFRRQYPSVLFPGKTQLEPHATPAPAPRLLDSINPVSWLRTARALRTPSPDAVIFQYWMPFFGPAYGTIARLLRRRQIPSLALVHNALPHERHVGDAWLARYFLRACHGHVVMSDAVHDTLRTLVGDAPPIAQIDHPVYARFGPAPDRSAARDALGLPPNAPVLLFFGFVRAYKGLDVLLKALPRVVAEVPNAQLVIAGEAYDDPARYQRLIDAHGLADRVHWHDRYIPNEAVARYFAAADVVVQPYVSATQSGVAQIAFHFARPMILTDVGGLAEIVPHEEAGLVVPPRNPDALAAAIVRFFRDDMRETLAAGVRRQRERFAPARLAEALTGLL